MILGIETSCDETSVALLARDGSVVSNLIASQIERHRPFGGVVPEIASREHLEHMLPVLERALAEGRVGLGDVEAIAVTAGPGLIGSILVGVAMAQGIAYGLGIPLLPVNHLEGHVFSPYLRKGGAPAIPLPSRFLSLVVSGGHSSIYDVRRMEAGAAPQIRMLNRTRDDAAGEIFDKVAKFLGLPYPGGPEIEALAARGASTDRYPFAIAQFKDETLDFSFSGLKATAIRVARREGLSVESGSDLFDFCASFQRAICDQIVDRLSRVWETITSEPDAPTELALAGGVAANEALRGRVIRFCEERGLTCRVPEKVFCTDNGAMIAFAAIQRLGARGLTDPRRVVARSRMPVGT